MQITPWLDRYQQRHPWAGFPLAVVYKFVDDQATYLAALITYYAFLSLFPLLLLLASVLGFVLQDNPELQRDILDSTLRNFPVIGEELGNPRGLRGSVTAVVVGAVIAVYGAIGVAQALQNAMNVVWAVPRHRRPNPIKARLRSLLLLATGGVAVMATTVLSALGSAADGFGADISWGASALATLSAIAINAAVFVLAFRIATAQKLSTRQAAPGALAAAVIWQLLQLFGSAYVARVSEGTSATYGIFALVLGLLAWIFLGAAAVVLCVEINVVRTKRLYPRALLTPFTDDVDLTRADEHTYTEAATAQRAKAFQTVHVTFDRDDPPPGSEGADQPAEPDRPPHGDPSAAANQHPDGDPSAAADPAPEVDRTSEAHGSPSGSGPR
jgi:YihY family inner membrane protein